MKKILTLLLCGCASFELCAMRDPFEADFSQKAKPPTLRILLAKDATRLLLEVRGGYELISPTTGLRAAKAKSGKCEVIHAEKDGLVWGDENFPGLFAVRIIPSEDTTIFLLNGTQYKGCLELYDRGGKLTAIEELDIERYLKATLNLPFQGETQPDLLEAVSVVARTNAAYLTRRSPHAFWHVDSKEIGYKGCVTTLQNLGVDQAVDRTHHLIMTYEGNPFPATWTKDSGGKTVSYGTLFRTKSAVPKGVEFSLAQRGREKRAWSGEISRQKLASLFNLPNVTAVDTFVDNASKRVYAVRIKSGKTFREMSFAQLQQKCPEVKSSEFTVQLANDRVLFKGVGEGAGSGLCLYSSHLLTDRGEKTKSLLNTFFPGVQYTSAKELLSK